MERLSQRVTDVNQLQESQVTYDFAYMDQESYEKYTPKSFGSLLDGFREYKS
jgi:type III restriction enzyme